jgi:mRNA interferase MazF
VRERGDVVLVNLDPVVGSEIGKTRPAIVLQNEMANRTSPTVTVIPLSTKVDRVFPFQVLIPAGEGGLDRDSKALCEQIRTLSTKRLLQHLGSLSPERMKEIHTALDRHLWF